MVPGIVIVTLVVGLFAVIARASRAAKAKRLGKLQLIADMLGGTHDSSSKAWGPKFGAPITIELATRGSGSSAENWTHIHVEVPAAYPLAIHIRRHERGDTRTISRGEMVDVIVGDKAFDDAFLVEAAPADVVREMLGPEIRALLSSHKEIDLDTVTPASGGRTLTLGVRGWLEEVTELRPFVEPMAKLGAQVREAYAKADAAVEARSAGDPYRPIVDAAPAREAQAKREAEVGQVEMLRGKRAAAAARVGVVIITVVFLAILVPLVCHG